MFNHLLCLGICALIAGCPNGKCGTNTYNDDMYVPYEESYSYLASCPNCQNTYFIQPKDAHPYMNQDHLLSACGGGKCPALMLDKLRNEQEKPSTSNNNEIEKNA